MKKALSIIILCLVIFSNLSILAACSDSNQKAEVSNTIANESWMENLPKNLDFSELEDHTVTMVVSGGAYGSKSQSVRSVVVDESSADTVDKKLFERNEKVERYFGIDIEGIYVSEKPNIIETSVMTVISAGSDDYDIISGTALNDIYIGMHDVLLDLNTLEQYDADYIDLSQPYWPKDYLESVNYKDKIWWLTGDITTSYLAEMQVIFVNGALYEKYLFANYGSLYDIVKRGEWTLELMMNMSNEIFMDTGTETDKNDDGDINGILLEHACADIYAVGAGVRFSTRDEDGELNITVANDTTIKYIEQFFELKNAKGTYYTDPLPHDHVEGLFASGKGLFFRRSLGFAESNLRDMENFYVVPLAKLDSSEKYRTRVGDWATIYGIPKACNNYAMAAATMEALAAVSYHTVTPVYYDEALKYKYSRDDGTAEMIDIIRSCTDVDFALMYGDQIGGLGYFFRFLTGAPSLAQIGSQARTWQNQFEVLLRKLDKIQ